MKWASKQTGFTIVELLIVIVVIAILAAITIVSYNGIQKQAAVAAIKSELSSAAKQLLLDKVKTESFPATIAAANDGQGLKASAGTNLRYRPNNTTADKTFCLTAASKGLLYMVTESTSPEEGSCYNLALGASSISTIATDGITTSNPYYGKGPGLVNYAIDLGSAQDVQKLIIWHYYADGRIYNETKTEVSEDNIVWHTVFDSATAGTYTETAQGHEINFPSRKVRYIRDWSNGSNMNNASHWVEIQAY